MFTFIVWQKLFLADDAASAVVTNLGTIASPLEQQGTPVTPTNLPAPSLLAWGFLGWGEYMEPEWFTKHIWAIWVWFMIYGPSNKESDEF